MESKFRQGKRSLKDSTTCEIIPYRIFFTQTIAKESIEVSKKSVPNGLKQWFHLHESCFYQNSEVDQELVYEMYQTEIQGNDWVRYGLAPMMTTQIVRS
jgi:hypothetical protein